MIHIMNISLCVCARMRPDDNTRESSTGPLMDRALLMVYQGVRG